MLDNVSLPANWAAADTTDGNSSESVLTFTPQLSDNGKALVCIATNPNLPMNPLQAVRILNVTSK